MQHITKAFFGRNSKIADFVPAEIENLLKTYYVIFPYQENVPHYCCIKEISGNVMDVYDGNQGGVKKRKKDTLFSKNKNITFSWEKYVNGDEKSKPAFSQTGLSSPINWIFPIYVGKDRAFYKWLRKTYYKKKAYLLKLDPAHLNMSGKILLIEK